MPPIPVAHTPILAFKSKHGNAIASEMPLDRPERMPWLVRGAQWKRSRRRRAALIALGVKGKLASNTAASGLGPWHLARSKALSVGLGNKYFRSLDLPSLFGTY
jgi:hypothetical protein